MTEEQSTEILNSLLKKIDTNHGSHLDMLAKISRRNPQHTELRQEIIGLSKTLGGIRLIMQYLLFDLEATRRERNRFRMTLEDRE